MHQKLSEYKVPFTELSEYKVPFIGNRISVSMKMAGPKAENYIVKFSAEEDP